MEVRGGFGGIPWKTPRNVLPQVVPRHDMPRHNIVKKDNNDQRRRGDDFVRDLDVLGVQLLPYGVPQISPGATCTLVWVMESQKGNRIF